jgi:hypothetical protein
MATINGTNLVVSIAGTAQALAKECDCDITNAGRDITTKSSAGWKETAPDGMRSWKVTGKGLIDFTASPNVSTLMGYVTGRTAVTLKFGASGGKIYTGSAVIKSLKMAGSIEETATYDFEFEGTSTLTEGTT